MASNLAYLGVNVHADMPTLPISVMNVMEGMRGNQEMIVSGESNVDETATPSLDYVVSGAQLLTVK